MNDLNAAVDKKDNNKNNNINNNRKDDQQRLFLDVSVDNGSVDIVDIVLCEWLAGTTLFDPKVALVTMCCSKSLASFTNNQEQTLSVVAFGSGVEILPCFAFDA